MSWLDGVRARLRPLWRRSAVEREIEEEFEFHLQREKEKNLAAGMGPEAAARAARLAFGGGDRFREEVRDAWRGMFAGLGEDLRHGVRRLLCRPGFALVALITLGLGIGANTAIFSLVRSVLLEPLPYAEADRLAMIWKRSADQTEDTMLSTREVLEYRKATVSFEQIAAYTGFNANLAEGEPERVRAAAVTANAFATLGASARHGRTLTPDEDAPGKDAVVVLGHGLWQRHFGGAPDVVGRQIRVNGQARTVVGVMPPSFRLPLDYREERPTELWVPAAIDPSADLPWGDRSYYIVARLARGVSASRATADLERAHATWERLGYLDESDGHRDRAAVALDDLLLHRVRPALWLLFGAVGFLLLITCANVAHLLLARADARRREIATQAALGASGFRLTRQLLVETGVLAVLGGALGVAFAHAGLRAALALTPVNVIRMRGVALDLEVLAFTVLLTLAATLGAGLAPALQLSRLNVADVLSAARGEVVSLRRGVRRLLVVGETALSLVLVLGAALLAHSLAELRRIDLGFEPRGVLTARVDLSRAEYPEPAQVNGFYRELLARVGQLPGVRSAGAARLLPLTGTIGDWSITIEGRAVVPGENPNGDWQIVTPGYLETMGIALRKGRFLTTADDETAPLVVVVNETMAERYWPGQEAIGKRFHLGTRDQPWMEIVGVTRNVRHNGVIEDPRAEMYLPHEQFARAKNDRFAQYRMALVIRTAGDPLAVLPLVREQVGRMDSRLPISEVRTLEDIAAAALAQPRFTTMLLGVFAALALTLAATGLYGLISFVTARRTHEIGVRVALGARPGAVTRLVLRDGLAMAVAGVVIGLLGSLWVTRLLAGQLYGVVPLDPLSFFAAPAVLLAVATLASYVPAWRAARLSPVLALRDE